jgi:hypothetical protein
MVMANVTAARSTPWLESLYRHEMAAVQKNKAD